MPSKKRQHYIPLWDEGIWNKVCADADAYWEARKRRQKAKLAREKPKVL